MAQELRTNTATRITIGPFLDKTDGITPEITLTVTSELLTFVVDTAGVPTLILDTAPTASGGANDMVHITSDSAGYYDLELAAADVNYLGRAKLSINDVVTHLPVFHEFEIVSQNYYDAKYGTGNLNADVLAISTDATAADNCELMFDGTGYAGGTARLKVDMDTLKTQAITCSAGVTVAAYIGTAAANTAQTGDTYALANGATGFVAIAGYIDTEVGVIAADMTEILTRLPNATAGEAGGIFIAGTNAATTITTSLTTTFTGNLTGNVGGNVTGSVGSVATGGIAAASFAAGAIDATAIKDAAIDNATFAADVGSTAFATNIVALAVFKALDNAIGDAVSLTADGLLEKMRKLSWISGNKITVVDASGNTVIYKDNSSTAAFTVTAMLTDDLTTTTRLRAA